MGEKKPTSATSTFSGNFLKTLEKVEEPSSIQQGNIEQLEYKPLSELKNTIIYGSEQELKDGDIVKVITVKTVASKYGKAKLLVRYQLKNTIISVFLSKAFIEQIAEKLVGQINTLKELEGKQVVLAKATVYIGNKVRYHFIPTKIVK